MAIFKRKKKKGSTKSFKLISDFNSPHIPFGSNISKSDVVKIAIDRIASQCAKLKPRYINSVNCMRCNYLIDLWNGGPIIVIPNNNHNHDEYYHKSFRGIYDMIDVCCSKEIAIIHKMEESYENY